MLLLALAARRASAQEVPLQIAQVIPLSGERAVLGDDWRDGVELAVQEANRRGGVLGRMIQTSTFDSGSSVSGRGSVLRALEGDPAALLGPLSEAGVAMAAGLARERRMLLITRGDAAGAPGVVLASPSQATRMARLVRYMRDELALRRVAVLTAGAEGPHPVREAFLRAAREAGMAVVAEAAGADSVFLDGPPAECGRALAGLRGQVPSVPVLGDAVLVDPATLARAGVAAEGARALVALSGDAPPLREFRDRFAMSFKRPPGVAAIEGHIAVGMVQAACERLGRVEPRELADALRGMRVDAARVPGVLLDTVWSASGEPERVMFMAQVQPGGSVSWTELPAA